ncbi:MAG TPA: hypothetical protein VLB67_16220, partial [Acidimicrobiia bacterium]|nr:hypothetical protein [Acidimicrobiia bacterium]
DDQVDALSAAFGFLSQYEDIRSVVGGAGGASSDKPTNLVGGGTVGSSSSRGGWAPNYPTPEIQRRP